MPVSNAIMLETIEEGLNEVFYDSFNEESIPQEATIGDVFKEKKSKKHAEYDQEMRGVGRFKTKTETGDIAEDDIEEKYKTTYTHVEFSNSVPVTYAQMKDQLYDLINENIGGLGDAARDSQYTAAFSIFRHGFNAAYPGADGKPLFAIDHPRDFGGTLTNKLTGKLSVSSLKQAIAMLAQQKSHSNITVRNVPAILLVSPNLFPLAVEISEADRIAKSANNDPNVFRSKYGFVVKQSPYIGSAEASDGGSDDTWFLIGKRHKLKRFTREPIMTWYTPWQQDRRMISYYNAYYRESYGWSSPIGIIGSDGTTGSYQD